MVTFDFYRETYGGDSVSEGEFTAFARDASASWNATSASTP